MSNVINSLPGCGLIAVNFGDLATRILVLMCNLGLCKPHDGRFFLLFDLDGALLWILRDSALR